MKSTHTLQGALHALPLPLKILLTTIVVVSGPFAVSQPNVTASSNRTSLSVGETLQYRLAIVGDDPPVSEITPPSGTGVELLQNTPTFRHRSRIGNQESLTLEWTYRAERPGTARLESISIPLTNRLVYTDPVDVNITAARTPATPGTPPLFQPPTNATSELFVRAEPSRQTVVAGQQVVVNYVLYFDSTLSPRETELIGTWDAPGFWKEELDIPYEDTAPQPVTIDDRPFRAVTIRRLALFPTRIGAITLPEMGFAVRLARSRLGADPFSNFLGSLNLNEEEITAPETVIRVEELPPGAPSTFNGAVGHFTMNSTLAPTSVGTGDPVQLMIAIRGDGNVATLDMPDLNLPRSVERFDPAEEREIDRTARHVNGSKSFTTTLVPTEPGTLEIPPLSWSYYDPNEQSYKTLSTESYRLTVTGPPLASSTTERDARAVSAPLLTREQPTPPFTVPSDILVALLLGGLLLPPLIILGTAGIRRSWNHRRKDSPKKRRKKAPKEATRALRRTPNATNLRNQADHVEGALKRLLEDRTGIAVQSVSRRSLMEALEGLLSRDSLHELNTLLSDCELARFAPTNPGGAALNPEQTGQSPEQRDLVTRASRLSKRITAET